MRTPVSLVRRLYSRRVVIVIGSVVAALVIVPVATMLTFSHLWHDDATERLRAGGHRLDTSHGPVQYDVLTRGTNPAAGPTVLLLHGTPGGYDQGLAIAGNVNLPSGRVVSVSRPGYLGTPVSSGRTSTTQADLAVAVLDHLDVSTALVVGVSGGGMTAMELAARHPQRVSGLVLWGSVTGPTDLHPEWSVDGPPGMVWSQWLSIRMAWLLPRLWLPKKLSDDPESLNRLEALVATGVPTEGREDGIRLDAANARSFRPPASDLTVPLLVVAGDSDEFAPYVQARQLVDEVPSAQLVTIEGGDSVTTLISSTAIGAVSAFVDSHAPVTP